MQQAKKTLFDIMEKDFTNFLCILIIGAYHTIPSEKQNWSTRPSLVAPIFPETMSRSRFLEIKKYLNLANNENLPNSKTAKVNPHYHKWLLNWQQFGNFHKKLLIDESMVPYREKHPIKQFIQNKHMRFGYKIWFICSTDGYPYNFQMYKGKEIGPKWEALGPRVVEDMASIIRHRDANEHILCFDNFFTSHQLLENVDQPNVITDYNTGIRGVDLLDIQLASYRH